MKGYEELVQTLKSIQSTGGMDISPEAICEYQDMIGHSSEEQLTELANSHYKEAFYKVYGYAYGTVEAIKFHCKHGEKIQKILEEKADLEAETDKLNFLLEEQKKDTKAQKEAREKIQSEYTELAIQNMKQAEELEALRAETQALKAKLYDLMTA